MWRLICGASVVDCFCFHAKCGVDSRARAPPLCPGGMGSLVHPLPSREWNLPFAIPFINYMQTASLNSRVVQHYMLYIYIEDPIAVYTQACKIRLTVLRDSCSHGFIHFMK